MDFRSFFQPLPVDEKRAFAEKVDAHVVYLYQIAKGDRNPSPAMAQRLVAAEPRLTLHELRPDIWTAPESAGA